tara:strand:+ start:165 stop:746 length:582 start_codon:yes stop_codon:yes gene_type:complete
MKVDKNDIGLIYGFIAIRIFILYLSSNVSSNIMNQIYTERVLINGEKPPKLIYQIYLFLVVDIIFNIFLIAFVWGVLNLTGNSEKNILNMFVIHYLVTLLMLFVILIIITHTMYIKKYFLYNDDGLRAIRALNDLILNVGAFISLIPVFLVTDIQLIPNRQIKVNVQNKTNLTGMINAKNAASLVSAARESSK